MRRAGFLRGISHPAAVRRELPIKGVLDKEPGFAVAYERQNPDFLSHWGKGGFRAHIEDEPCIWRPARGPYSQIRVLRLQQQLTFTCPVGILLINAQHCLVRSAAEQNVATIWRP